MIKIFFGEKKPKEIIDVINLRYQVKEDMKLLGTHYTEYREFRRVRENVKAWKSRRFWEIFEII